MRYTYVISAIAIALLCATQNYAAAQTRPTVYSPGIMLSGMSDNGNYAIGVSMGDEDVDNPQAAGGSLVDLRTHDIIDVPAPTGWADVKDVADDGTVVGSSAGKPGYWKPETGEWTTFDVPALWGGGCFMAVTPDAHYAVGYYFDSANVFFVAPMMYDLTTGESKPLNNLPTHDLTGADMHQNMFFNISPDGRYVLGQMSQSYMMPVGMFTYIYDTVEDTWRPIAYHYDSATGKFTPRISNFYFTVNQFFSCDGNWVTGSAYMVYDGGELEGGSEGYYPYRYNVKDDKFEVYTNSNDANIGGNKITADGVVLGCSPIGNPYPSAMIRTGNFFISLDQVIQQVYNMSVPDLIHDTVTGAFEALSADGLTALMITYDNSYVITMPEPFAEAASKVDLLGNYNLNIPEDSHINRISEVQITFDRAIDCTGYPQLIRLFDGQGKQVRTASGFMISPSNDHTAVVTFRSTALNPDERYTIDIPAENIWLKEDNSIKSKQIQIHYIGRQNGPVQVKNISPASGSALAELNSSPDNITITFDTPVAISESGSCALYNADDNSLIGTFSAMAEGSTATFFPLASYQLYKGSHYRVVIGAGTVTDLSGSGGNEEITLYYSGTYVRQISNDDIYLFKSTCDNYDDFIFWKDEFNEPAATPANWGFTSETPWVLIRDNEQTEDMALASHSMFETPEWSDSWLIVPQIYIPDANTDLVFDAQSYKGKCSDVLRVYICVDDANYNYFNSDLKKRFITIGDLVVEEVLTNGGTDEGLTGEWWRYNIPLSKYAGKNIYIAFVNNNYNQSAIFLDNIQVMRNMDFLITNQTPTAVVNSGKVTVSGIVSVGSDAISFKGINVNLLDADGAVIGSIDDKNANLKYGDAYKFTFTDALDAEVGEELPYSIQVNSGSVSTTFNYTLKNLTFQPDKYVVLEEFTGSSCGNCPLGIRAIETLEQMYPDNFIPVTLRTYGSDMYAAGATDYTTFLGMNAAPSGRINRGEILSPSFQNGSEGLQFFGNGAIDSNGDVVYLWGDAVKDELNTPAEACVSFTATYDANTGDISVPCNVKFALNRKNMSLGVYAIVLEDKLPTYQLNYFATSTDRALGEWGVGGMYGKQTVTTWQANDVVRYVVNGTGFNGTVMPQSEFTVNTDYSITLEGNVPNGRLSNPANCKVVVMLIDRTTGKIINAAKAPMTTSAITDIEYDNDGEVTYYNLNGMKVTNPVPGQIYIRVFNGKADKVVM